jgi:hypothetical protein
MPSSTVRCSVCASGSFDATQYRLDDGGTVPALHCVACRALILDENAADSDEERASVRFAIAQRQAAIDNDRGE